MDEIFDADSSSSSDASIQAVTVSELNGHLKEVVEGTFPMMWVAGEVTDVAKPRSGHIYFTLKDDNSQIRAVIWRGVASRLRFDLENGQSILCFGGLEVYTVRGSYQIVVRKAQPQGVGALQVAFEQLKARLNREGLFSSDRKRPLPSHPRRVGIVTSPSGAAIHDFLVAAENRMVGAEIFVIPAQVQGAGAADSISLGLRAAAMVRPRLDVVIVSRGGGSLEDLWCFNEEPVVRAIAECPIPTVSAVGHEVDVTLSDLAADVRALTPTDAATRVFSDRGAISERIEDLQRRLHRSMEHELQRRRYALESMSRHSSMTKPLEMVHLRARRIDELDRRAGVAMQSRLQQSTAGLATMSASLSALSPLNTLARGYSVTTDERGNAVSQLKDVAVGERLQTRLADGQVVSVVESTERITEPASGKSGEHESGLKSDA